MGLLLDGFWSGLLDAMGILFLVGIVFFVWQQAREAAQHRQLYQIQIGGALICLVIAGFIAGPPSQLVCTDIDPIFGSCESYDYQVDDRERTDREAYAALAKWFVLLYIPVWFGARRGYKEKV